MPLRNAYGLTDHWKPWFGFNLGWACQMLERLNLTVLSPDYCAQLDVFNPWEDMSHFEAVPDHTISQVVPDRGFPPLPVLSTPAAFVDPGFHDLKVRYEGTGRWAALVAITHPEYILTEHGRRAFVSKCARWLQRGTNVVAINTCAPADLHGELTSLLGCASEMAWESPTGLSAVAYRVARQKDRLRFDAWPYSLAVGEHLPTVPLWLEADLAVPLDLEMTFINTCKSLRIA
jgi:hypothetical protein